jgi:hypothetical protein
MHGNDAMMKREAMADCDEMKAALGRLRNLLKDAETDRNDALYESVSSLFEEMDYASECSWKGFEDVLKNMPE